MGGTQNLLQRTYWESNSVSVITVQLGQCYGREQPKQIQHMDIHFQERFIKMRLKKKNQKRKEKEKKGRKEASLKQRGPKTRREQAAWMLLKKYCIKISGENFDTI